MVLADVLANGLANQSKPVPVTLAGETLALEQPLRWLPGRRLVALACWQGKPVVAKLYAASTRGRAEFRRERAALEALQQRGVAAPACLAGAQDDEGALLLLEYLDGDTAAQALAALPDRPARQAMVVELAAWVADQHKRGVLQTDIHLDNFLCHAGQWCLLDADACRFGKVSRRAAADNLAVLLAQFDPLDVPGCESLRAALPNAPEGARLSRARSHRYRHMLKKTLRECSEFLPLAQRGVRGMVRRDGRAALMPLLQDGVDGLERAMEKATMLKNGGSATVVLEPETGWVIKRYNLKSRWHWAKRQFGRTRARNAWLAGYFLRFIGIETPRPVAFLEEHEGPFTGRCWLLTEPVQGEGLDGWPAHRILEARFSEPLMDLFALMEPFRFAHGDMKASNVLLAETGISVIDLDAFRRYRSGRRALAARRRDEARLLRNWPEGSVLHRQLAGRIRERVS